MKSVNLHPLYTAMSQSWVLGRDSYAGEDAIKAKGTLYLPATSGQIQDGQGLGAKTAGELAYQAYKTRAVYPEIYKEAVKAAIGIMHKRAPTIELPTVLESMRETATPTGESLELLLRRINTRQLITGRVGLLGDVRIVDGVPTPTIAVYEETAILNWNDSNPVGKDINLSVVVLDESGYDMDPTDFSWVHVDRVRVLALTADGAGSIDSENGKYSFRVFQDSPIVLEDFETPTVRGEPLRNIPFVCINSVDISPDPDTPPLEGLANQCLTIYRGEADYRQSLFMQGQDTLVKIGSIDDPDDPQRTGAGACIHAPLGGDVKYIGVSSAGLSEQRTALENDYDRAYRRAGQLDGSYKGSKESGEALNVRMAAQTATLPEIAMAGAEGLQWVLRRLAEWFGGNPQEVVVKPNLKYVERAGDGITLMKLVEAKVSGAPYSRESLHEWMRENGFTRKTYEDELEAIQEEEPGV